MRTLARRLALPAAALSAALALTACQSGTSDASAPATAPSSAPTPSQASGTPESPADPATAPTPTTPSKPTKAASPTKAGAPGGQQAGGKQPGGSTSDGPVRTCTAADTKVVASKVSRPINHLVLTVTNVGGRPCNALNAPFVGFEDSQAPIRILEDSKPQAVVTLAPGESGYASVILTGEPGPDTHGRTVRKISVYLTSDSGKTVTAPSGTFADDGAAVSYWQRTLEDALVH
ncbi:DUF4232 domain-containing protein [Streptomyces sp. NPDC056069]|uniref:DUF4232 domain-containing protein n=1 Tax=Streptomyces sp. NPDC056069 TaxID=3345702 RepID=UPI0035E0F05C